MRVMWILGRTPNLVAEATGSLRPNGGSWQDALLDSVRTRPGIELLVAYAGVELGRRSTFNDVEFADMGPIEPPGQIARVAARWKAQGTDPAVLEECLRLVGEWAPDLIHLHGTEAGLGLVAGRVDVPVLMSIQGLLSAVEVGEREWPSPRRLSPSWLGDFARGTTSWHHARRLHSMALLERVAMRQFRCIAGRTMFDQRVAAVLAPQAQYVHVGEVLREPFHGPRWERLRQPGPKTLALCGSSAGFSRKGVDTAIEATKLLQESGSDARLRVYGAAPDSLAGRLAVAHAARLGIPEMMHLSGPLDADEVAAELLAADVYVHPSRVDNSPNALCEAMMLGVPCVASTAGGIPSLASDGEDALLVPPADAYSLAGAVRSLLASEELGAKLSEAARTRAIARHDPVAVRDQLLAAYAITLAIPAAGAAPRHGAASSRRPSSEESAVFGK